MSSVHLIRTEEDLSFGILNPDRHAAALQQLSKGRPGQRLRCAGWSQFQEKQYDPGNQERAGQVEIDRLHQHLAQLTKVKPDPLAEPLAGCTINDALEIAGLK
jgi:hypothetical protein